MRDVETTYFPCRKAQWVDVEGLIRRLDGDPTWQVGQLRAWSYRNGEWVGHVHYTPAPGRSYTAMLPAHRIRGAAPPRGQRDGDSTGPRPLR